MIKKYIQFILENKSDDETIGQYIERISKDNKYIKDIIVSNYTKEIPSDIKLSNAIDSLKEFDKNQLYNRVIDYIKNGEEDKKADVNTNSLIGDKVSSGRMVFKSFLRLIISLGKKDELTNWEDCPKDYIYYKVFKGIDSFSLKENIKNRFRSLYTSIESVHINDNKSDLFFGINNDLEFNYGIKMDNVKITMGKFEMKKSIYNWLVTLDLSPIYHLKKDLSHIHYNELLLISKIKKSINNYTLYKIDASIITLKYVNTSDFNQFKEKFKKFLSKFKWCDRLLVSFTNLHEDIIVRLKIK